jgi:hypothetical protein
VPKFCRHNRLLQNCPICSREQAIEPRPLVSSSTPRTSEPRPASGRSPARRDRPQKSPERSGVTVRRLHRGEDDGYRSPLVPALRSSEEAQRLADEIAFGASRLTRLAGDPPGLYAEVADPAGDVEERTWLAFLIAYLYPLEREDPFSSIASVRTSWRNAHQLELDEVEIGPRSAHAPGRGLQTVNAYRGWAQRAGSQAAAFGGDAAWTPERRFARVFERLALPGLHRDARFELLVSLGALGVYDLDAGSLALGGVDEVTVAAKRVLGIGDQLVLERRAAQLAEACSVPAPALDLALYNWGRGERTTGGLGPGAEPGRAELETVLAAFDL